MNEFVPGLKFVSKMIPLYLELVTITTEARVSLTLKQFSHLRLVLQSLHTLGRLEVVEI